jgi:hypothetical protein
LSSWHKRANLSLDLRDRRDPDPLGAAVNEV